MVFILIILIGGLFSFFGPWWIAAPVCFVLNWWKTSTGRNAFWISASAVASLWLLYTFYLHMVAPVELSGRVGGIFTAGIPVLSSIPGAVVTYFLTVLIAVLVGGFAGMSGVQVRRFFKN